MTSLKSRSSGVPSNKSSRTISVKILLSCEISSRLSKKPDNYRICNDINDDSDENNIPHDYNGDIYNHSASEVCIDAPDKLLPLKTSSEIVLNLLIPGAFNLLLYDL